MDVVSTRISPGSPTSAGISKDSKERMKISSITEKNAGSMSRSEMRRIVCQSFAPHAAEASSIHGSERRCEHQKHKRRPEQRLDEDHPPQRIYVHHRLALIEELLEPEIHRPRFPED